MAKGRMIASEIFTDEFVSDLSITERMLWIGLIAQCADDQGRLQDRPNLINSRIFPDDSLPIDVINAGIDKFVANKKIVRYTIDNKKLIQIVKWWDHQSPNWAAPSIYPAPSGWTDRIKVHVAGSVKVKVINWDKKGGFEDIANHVSNQDSNHVSKPIDDVKKRLRRDEIKGEDEVESPPAGDDDSSHPWIGKEEIDLFEKLSGLVAPIANNELFGKWVEALQRLKISGASEDIQLRAIQELSEKKYRIAGPWSIEKACGMILAERRRENVPKTRRFDSDGEFGEFIRH